MKKYAWLVIGVCFLSVSGVALGEGNTVESISVILISIMVNDQPSLFILVAEDGTLNRMGTGTVDNKEKNFFIELTKEPYFRQLKERIMPYWLERAGVYDVGEKRGKTAELCIVFGHRDGSETAVVFLYGSESEGPPADICDFVAYAVELTEAWYQQWMQSTRGLKH